MIPNIISDIYNLQIKVLNFAISNSTGVIGKGKTSSKSLEK